MSYIPTVQQRIDPNNSTTLLLNSMETFFGSATDVSLYNTIVITAFSNVDSEINGLSLQYSNDMETWTNYNNYNVIGNVEKTINVEVIAKYFKLSYALGWTNQAVFRLQTILSPTLKISNAISRLSSDALGNLNVNVKNNLDLTLIDQLDFVYDLDLNKVTTVFTNSADGILSNGGFTITSNGSPCMYTLKLKSNFDYKFGQNGLIKFAMSFNGSVIQVSKYVGVGDANDGYFFGCDSNSQFGILYRSSSSGLLIETFITPNFWNGDTMNGLGDSHMLLDQTQGNVYQIIYPLIGYGNVEFYILSQFTGEFVLVHTIQNINKSITSLVRNPTMCFSAQLTCIGNSMGTFTLNTIQHYIEGLKTPKYNSLYSYTLSKTVNDEFPCLFSFKNPETFKGINNTSCIKLKSMSVYLSTPNAINLGLVLNGSLVGMVAFANVNGSSIAQVDNGTVGVSGGIQVYNVICGSSIIDLLESGIIVRPNDVITFVAIPIGVETIGCNIALNWIEDTY